MHQPTLQAAADVVQLYIYRLEQIKTKYQAAGDVTAVTFCAAFIGKLQLLQIDVLSLANTDNSANP